MAVRTPLGVGRLLPVGWGTRVAPVVCRQRIAGELLMGRVAGGKYGGVGGWAQGATR